MEKLVDLLNQFEKEKKSWREREVVLNMLSIKWETFVETTAVAISKEYWFIERLVYNDKIDFIKLIQKQGNWEIDNIKLNPIKELEYYKLLMLLSIQDKPLGFLISILK